MQCRALISGTRIAVSEFHKVDLQCTDEDLMTGIAVTDFSGMNLQCESRISGIDNAYGPTEILNIFLT